jgi:hypothetical protein
VEKLLANESFPASCVSAHTSLDDLVFTYGILGNFSEGLLANYDPGKSTTAAAE